MHKWLVATLISDKPQGKVNSIRLGMTLGIASIDFLTALNSF